MFKGFQSIVILYIKRNFMFIHSVLIFFFSWKRYNACKIYLYMNKYTIPFNEYFAFNKVICCFPTHPFSLPRVRVCKI